MNEQGQGKEEQLSRDELMVLYRRWLNQVTLDLSWFIERFIEAGMKDISKSTSALWTKVDKIHVFIAHQVGRNQKAPGLKLTDD